MRRATWPLRDVIHTPEIHNVSQCHQKQTQPWPQETSTENFVKLGHVVFEICE